MGLQDKCEIALLMHVSRASNGQSSIDHRSSVINHRCYYEYQPVQPCGGRGIMGSMESNLC